MLFRHQRVMAISGTVDHADGSSLELPMRAKQGRILLMRDSHVERSDQGSFRIPRAFAAADLGRLESTNRFTVLLSPPPSASIGD